MFKDFFALLNGYNDNCKSTILKFDKECGMMLMEGYIIFGKKCRMTERRTT